MKKAFSLLELIFAIVLIAIIASFAVPKFMDTRDSALVSTIQRDIATISTSIQAYHLSNGKIEKISDAVSLNSKNWNISDTQVTDKNSCLTIKLDNSAKKLDIIINDSTKEDICKKLKDEGIVATSYKLM